VKHSAISEGKPTLDEVKVRTVCLKPKGQPDTGSALADPEPRAVLIEREDEMAWYGRPLTNPACSILAWPKSAWEVNALIHATIIDRKGDRRIMGALGKHHTVCHAPLTDRDVTMGDFRILVGNPEWSRVLCQDCNRIVGRGSR
jgi:hypothetical protein